MPPAVDGSRRRILKRSCGSLRQDGRGRTTSPTLNTCAIMANLQEATELLRSDRPSGNVVPVIPHLLLAFAVGPDPVVAVEGRRFLDLRLGHIRAIAFELLVVGELVPRDRVMMDAHSQKAAEGHIDVENATAHLLDQKTPDGADLHS